MTFLPAIAVACSFVPFHNPLLANCTVPRSTLRFYRVVSLLNVPMVSKKGEHCLQITIVGQVLTCQVQQLQLTLKIDDSTGVVDVKYWIENNDMVSTI